MPDVPLAFHDVVCGLLVRAGRILLVHRSPTRLWAANCWDAPGGHIEPGESEREALGREMREELGITIRAEDSRLVGNLTGGDYDARVFLVGRWSGEIENRARDEHDEIRWFREQELPGLVLADPDLLRIISKVLLEPHEPSG